VIEIPSGMFSWRRPAPGCASSSPALAFGALYALEMFRSPGRRLMVMVLAIVVPGAGQ
jgi:hypothetical protein